MVAEASFDDLMAQEWARVAAQVKEADRRVARQVSQRISEHVRRWRLEPGRIGSMSTDTARIVSGEMVRIADEIAQEDWMY